MTHHAPCTLPPASVAPHARPSLAAAPHPAPDAIFAEQTSSVNNQEL